MNICGDCGKIWTDEQVVEITHGLWERVEPGDIFPSGECPECGALCTPDDTYSKTTAKEANKHIQTLISYLLENHMDELESQHQGDADHDGEAPEACSYCLAIDEARQFLVSVGESVEVPQ